MDDTLPPSVVLAVRPPRAQPAAVDELADLLVGAGIEIERLTALEPPSDSPARWQARVVARMIDETRRELLVSLEPAPQEWIGRVLADYPCRGVLAVDKRAATAATWCMTVSTELGQRPLWDYHAQLKLLRAVAPDAVLMLDACSFTARSGEWLHDVASSIAPPAPSSLYAVHCVHFQPGSYQWLHTHGLDRCGIIELDLLAVPPDMTRVAAELIEVAATSFIEQGIPEPGEVFPVGHDIDLLWLPWEEGVARVPRQLVGGARDRVDEAHTGERGILFAPGSRARHVCSIEVYREVLADQPVLYLSDMATQRAALLAKERLPRFRALFERFRKHGEEGTFLVKLGYPIDDACTGREREHLWFEVHGFGDEEVDASLRNRPYNIARFVEGQRGMHALSRLSDWSVECRHGRFEPGSIGELERLLGGRVCEYSTDN